MKRNRLAAIAILAAATLCTPASAQSLSDLLQKAIYTRETAGDLDDANPSLAASVGRFPPVIPFFPPLSRISLAI